METSVRRNKNINDDRLEDGTDINKCQTE